MEQSVSVNLGGKTLTISTGKMAKLAGGSAVVQLGGTVVLVAASASKTASPNRDFVPLTVDYRERTYAAGKIPGGFFKREGRPTEKEVLSSRLSDRPIRPLFEKNFPYETQIMATVVSADQEHDSDVLALIGASCAMNLSDIPFPEPIAGVRVGRVDGEFVIMPTFEQLDGSDMDVVVAGTADNIIMVEGGTREVSESDMIAALEFAMGHIREIVTAQRELMANSAKPKRPLVTATDTHELERELDQGYRERLRQAIRIPGKEARQEEVDRVGAEAMAALKERFVDLANHIPKILHEIERDELREWCSRACGRTAAARRDPQGDSRGRAAAAAPASSPAARPRRCGRTLGTRATSSGSGAGRPVVKSYMLHYLPPFSVGGSARSAARAGARSATARSQRARSAGDSCRHPTPSARERHPRVERFILDEPGAAVDGPDGRRLHRSRRRWPGSRWG
jgi:polyribonucleotide nucleotidyltransferase